MKIAIFDFDGTLFPKQSVPFFMQYYLQSNHPKGPYVKFLMKLMFCMFKYKFPLLKSYGKEEFRRQVALNFVQMFNGTPKENLDTFFEEVAEEVIKELNPNVVEEVRRCKETGYHCVILSGCYDTLLKHIAIALEMDTVIGTPIEVDMNKGNCINIRTLDIATGVRKVEKLKKIFGGKSVDWIASTSYGDSSYDRNILELVGNPVAVRPDEILRVLANEKSWRIIE